MLQRIIDSCGDRRTTSVRSACTSSSIRDEIRGRSLLSDDVRDEVMRLRRRGAVVQLHDDGGLDELEVDDLRRIHLDWPTRSVGRTTPTTSSCARCPRVRFGGHRRGLRLDLAASESAALGAGLDDDDEDGDEDDSVALWLEIPRHESV